MNAEVPSTIHTTIRVCRLSVLVGLGLLHVTIPASAGFAQGSIFGLVYSSDGFPPSPGDMLFFGFLDDTDEEIRVIHSDGAGYDAGYWFDDFQNYLTETAGDPYDYYFYNKSNDEGYHLEGLIPTNSFQQEDIQLAPVSRPPAPAGVTVKALSPTTSLVTWDSSPGLTYHIYRRFAQSNGSFFRLDNLSGDLTDPGIDSNSFVDSTTDGVSFYQYLVIAEDVAGNYSPAIPAWICGNVDGSFGDGPISIDDVVYLLTYIFHGGPAPIPLESADVDCSGETDIDDVTWILAYAFLGGNPPCDPDGDGSPDC